MRRFGPLVLLGMACNDLLPVLRSKVRRAPASRIGYVAATVPRNGRIAERIAQVAGEGIGARSFVIGFVTSVFSAVANNHPAIDTMSWVIRELGGTREDSKVLAFSALIGGGLGPKMLPIGSFAALLWFGILRRRNVEVSYASTIELGVPVTLAAIFLSLAVLHVEALLL